MRYTQVELSFDNTTEVWWLPVPEGRAKVSEKVTRKMNFSERYTGYEDWVITQVCITLPEEFIPENARLATNFQRQSQTHQYMSI